MTRTQRPIATLAALAAAALYTVYSVRATGMLALSDDDYARITIAASQAEVPRLDPSGTSWLPFPFWLYGAAIYLGNCIHVPALDSARLVPWLLSVPSVWLVYASARALTLQRSQAIAGALVSLGTAQVAQLASMTGPEHLTACLCCFALAARAATHDSQRSEMDTRTLGVASALCVTLSALSRYEAWPVALVVATFGLVPRRNARWTWRVFETCLALAGPSFWLLHSAWAHGDALYFLGRVATFRAALGTRFSAGQVLTAYAKGLFAASPALSVASLVVALRIGRARPKTADFWRYAIPACGALATLFFLVAGALAGGVPTHHAERAMLLLWLLAGIAIATYAPLVWPLALIQLAILPFTVGRSDGFSRHTEEALGHALRGRMKAEERALIVTPDYGYYAVLAALGRTGAARVDQYHDPRKPDGESHFRSDTDVSPLRTSGVRFVIAPSADWAARYLVRREKTLSLYDLGLPR